jgi:hypothetical protein
MTAIRADELSRADSEARHPQKWQKLTAGSHFCHSCERFRPTRLVSVRVGRIGRCTTGKELIMISSVFLVLAAAAVLSVYTVIGRLAVPPEDRVPWRELGWGGWVHTLRRSLVFLGDWAPRVDAHTR